MMSRRPLTGCLSRPAKPLGKMSGLSVLLASCSALRWVFLPIRSGFTEA
jgi:hypothetical protein